MKLKFQSGGTFVPPYVVYQPTILPDSYGESSSKSSKKASSDSNEMEDALKLLDKIDGLPGDIIAAKSKITQLLNTIERNANSPYGTTAINNAYMEIIGLVKSINSQKQYYNEAKKQAQEKGSWNDVMINSDGAIRVITEDGSLDWVSLQEYQENRDYYRPVTNGQMLDWRFNGQLGLEFDTESVTAAADGVSMQSIQEKIKSVIQNIEANQLSSQGYVTKEQREVLKGVQTYKDITKTGSNIFKEKITNKDQANQIQHAFNYLYEGLTVKEKTLLHFNASNIEGGVMGLIGQLIGSKQGLQYEYEPADPLTKGRSKDTSTTIKEFELGPAELLEAGFAQSQNIIIQTPKGKDAAIKVPTVKLPLMDSEKNPLGASVTLDKVFEGPHVAQLGDISMGGAFIRPEATKNVVVNGGNIYMGYLPVAYTNDGSIKPNLSLLEKYKEVMDIVKKQNLDPKRDIDKINKIFQEKELPLLYNKNGEINITKYHKFIMLNGVALNRAFSQDVQLEEWLTEVDDMNEKLNNLVTIGKSHGEQIDFDHKSWADSWMPFWNSHDSMYRGTIFIAAEDNAIANKVGQGDYPNVEEAEILSAKQQDKDAAKGIVSTGLL